MRRRVALLMPLLLAACSRTYHPEYHPETSYSYDVTYVKNALFVGPRAPAASSSGAADPDDTTPRGEVSSSGAVVIYGNFTGNIYLPR